MVRRIQNESGVGPPISCQIFPRESISSSLSGFSNFSTEDKIPDFYVKYFYFYLLFKILNLFIWLIEREHEPGDRLPAEQTPR